MEPSKRIQGEGNNHVEGVTQDEVENKEDRDFIKDTDAQEDKSTIQKHSSNRIQESLSLKVKSGHCILIYHLGQILAITWYNPIGTQT